MATAQIYVSGKLRFSSEQTTLGCALYWAWRKAITGEGDERDGEIRRRETFVVVYDGEEHLLEVLGGDLPYLWYVAREDRETFYEEQATQYDSFDERKRSYLERECRLAKRRWQLEPR